MKTPKYPRIVVSGKRHNMLTAEARKRKIALSEVAEEKFRKFDKKS